MAISNNEQKTVNQQKEQVAKEQATQTPSSRSSNQREIQCPFCAPHVKKKDVTGGRSEIVIPFFDPPLRIPIPPFLTKTIKPDPQKCTCEGKQKFKDVSDDVAKYNQVKQQAQANIEKSIELEAKMGTGGNRTTVIEKSDTLVVGLGFNKNVSYETIPEGHFAPSKLNTTDPENLGFATGGKYNAVVGKQTSVGWPSAVGNYKITCANSFNVTAGAGGITLDTKGPLTFNSGILNLTGPQVNIGSASGPLTLEGDTVSIGGKTITLTPTDANVFVKGTVSTTGNIVVGGQLHAETLSFSKASCPAKDKRTSTNAGNPDTTQTSPAVWGGPQVKAITSSVLDIQIYFQNIMTNFETAAISVLSPSQMTNLMNRIGNLAKSTIVIDSAMITGICITPAGPGIVMNFPHVHGLPSLVHDHGIRVPDIDCDNYSSPQSLRAAVVNEALTSNAPAKKKTTTQELLKFTMAIPGSVSSFAVNAQKKISWVLSHLS
jgi:hypothetical protein